MTTKPTVVITYPFHKELIRTLLKPNAKVVLAQTESLKKKWLPKADALISLLIHPVDSALLEMAPKLKVVGNMAVGVDNIDLKACRRRKVHVVNTPGVLTDATAELTLTLLLACARRLPEGERLCRKNQFKGWLPDLLLGKELRGKTAVIVGYGRIGKATAKLFRALGLRIQPIRHKDTENRIQKLLKKADVISIHLPLKPETRHWLNARRIKLLSPGCIVLNTARGPLIDERALIIALKNRKIFAAGLDVFEHEPEIPPLLRKLKNVVLLPHVGSATEETRRKMASLVIQGVLAILNGKHPPNQRLNP